MSTLQTQKVIHKKNAITIDFSTSKVYFPQVMHNGCNTYQQVCYVKLAFTYSQNCDSTGYCGRVSDRMMPYPPITENFTTSLTSLTQIAYILR